MRFKTDYKRRLRESPPEILYTPTFAKKLQKAHRARSIEIEVVFKLYPHRNVLAVLHGWKKLDLSCYINGSLG